MPCLCLSVSGTTNCGNLWLLPPPPLAEIFSVVLASSLGTVLWMMGDTVWTALPAPGQRETHVDGL